ncbi:MAG: 3-dehydroquinate synthase [Acidobacteria bacterium]|nr:MAG: 3-dehydroquinate synthase [Acidobacteriota bacterium]
MSPAIERQTLPHPRGATDIVIGVDAIGAAAESFAAWAAGRTLFVLSPAPVRRLHGPSLAPLIAAAERRVEIEVPDGEAAKTVGECHRLWEAMLERGGKRDSRLLTFGGGTTGDVGGFVAGCFLRGISYVQVPTTLLAQVDAAIGGKTGVDLEGGKNTVGLFHHPAMVISDTRLLATLPPAELRSGLVEVVKMAFLLDPPLLERVEATLPALLAADARALVPVVAGACAAKCRVVAADPEEGDRRRLLNFGHTLGHALEAALGYRHLRHGEAVAYGLLFALRLARARGLEAAAAARLRALLARFDLPPLPALEPRRLYDLMRRDKKAREAGMVWVLPATLGRGVMVGDVRRREVLAALDAFLADPFGE